VTDRRHIERSQYDIPYSGATSYIGAYGGLATTAYVHDIAKTLTSAALGAGTQLGATFATPAVQFASATELL
jgi:hypothetical protein